MVNILAAGGDTSHALLPAILEDMEVEDMGACLVFKRKYFSLHAIFYLH